MNKEDYKYYKEIIVSYKEKLEKEIVQRSKKLKIPKSIIKKIINENKEIINLQKTITELDTHYSTKIEKEI